LQRSAEEGGTHLPARNINVNYIRNFFGIPEDENGQRETEEILKKLQRLSFANGEDICTIDGDPDGMFFLESGTAVVLNREGDQVNIMRAGQCFGEYAVLANQKRLSTVRSQGKTIVFRLNTENMMEILIKHPEIYGELMKRVYGQVSKKHSQVLDLSRRARGILQAPQNKKPMTTRQMLLNYGVLAILLLLTVFLVPAASNFPIFLIPLALMIVYVLFTRRTLESLIVAGMFSTFLLMRRGLFVDYTDCLMRTMENADNVFTVLVMALMGGMIELVEASGAVTAFKKHAERRIGTKKGARLAMMGILAVTAVDDCLNLLCAAVGLKNVVDEQKIPREDSALMLSFLPTTLSSFLPVSLWGIFVIGTLNSVVGGEGVGLFCRSIPFNFFSVIAVLAMVFFCFDCLPRTKLLKNAESRIAEGGNLWPEGSEKYLEEDDTEVWGKIGNLLLPILTLVFTSILVRSLAQKSFAFDSTCGLVASLVVIFFLYCAQGLMSPEQYAEHMISGIQGMVLPIVLYLLTMCFSAALSEESMVNSFDQIVLFFEPIAQLLPAALFLLSMLLACALGSSWAMYAVAFPIAIHIASSMGMNVPLCVGAVCAAGIAGEKNCVFTGDSFSVGTAVGCNPKFVLSLRISYSLIFSAIALLLYVIAGYCMI